MSDCNQEDFLEERSFKKKILNIISMYLDLNNGASLVAQKVKNPPAM